MTKHLKHLWQILWRKKEVLHPGDSGNSLEKCLSVVNITCLGLATTLGTGIYVLLPEAAREYAGPCVVISTLVASVTSCLGSLCYSEVATIFPRGGSAYVYVYATTGEFFAFLLGWGMVLEYSVGIALAAKACTQYLDVTINGTLSSMFESLIGKLDVPGLDRYVDMPSMLLVVVGSLLMAVPLKLLCSLNNVLIAINLLVLSGIVLICTFNMDAENWTAGAGFFPNGASGLFSGASLCYFSFIGYDIMAITSSETIHPSKVLPTAATIVFLVGLLSLFATSIAITLFIPTSLLQPRGALLEALAIRGVVGIQYFAIVGATAAFLSATLASLLAHSRLLQSLSADGLIFQFLAKRLGKGTGCSASIASCVISSVIASLCDTNSLIHALGTATLASATAVAVSVLFLRYGVSEPLPLEPHRLSTGSSVTEVSADNNVDAELKTFTQQCLLRKNSARNVNRGLIQSESNSVDYGSMQGRSLSVEYVNDSFVTCLSEFSPHWSTRTPNQKSSATAAGLVAATILVMLLMGVMTLHVPRLVPGSSWWAELTAVCLLLIVMVCVVLVCRQPRHKHTCRNRVPCVPLLPMSAILMDVHLIVGLPYTSWLVFIVWTLLGALLYLGYGLWHSALSVQEHADVSLLAMDESNEECHDDEEVLAESF